MNDIQFNTNGMIIDVVFHKTHNWSGVKLCGQSAESTTDTEEIVRRIDNAFANKNLTIVSLFRFNNFS